MNTMSESTRAVRFRAFHEKNPQVYDRLRQMALALKAAGHRRWGMRNLWEKLRYDLAVQTTATNFRLNDHFPPFYARLLMKQCPELKGFFEIRGEGKVAA